jgi:hypothetical protein
VCSNVKGLGVRFDDVQAAGLGMPTWARPSEACSDRDDEALRAGRREQEFPPLNDHALVDMP